MGIKSIALNMIHIPVTLVPPSIYLIPVLLYLSFLIYLTPVTQKTNAVIVTIATITNNILSILTSKDFKFTFNHNSILYYISILFINKI